MALHPYASIHYEVIKSSVIVHGLSQHNATWQLLKISCTKRFYGKYVLLDYCEERSRQDAICQSRLIAICFMNDHGMAV